MQPLVNHYKISMGGSYGLPLHYALSVSKYLPCIMHDWGGAKGNPQATSEVLHSKCPQTFPVHPFQKLLQETYGCEFISFVL